MHPKESTRLVPAGQGQDQDPGQGQDHRLLRRCLLPLVVPPLVADQPSRRSRNSLRLAPALVVPPVVAAAAGGGDSAAAVTATAAAVTATAVTVTATCC